MITARDIARPKQGPSISPPTAMGDYDHGVQRRWIGDDASLIEWTMKSDTMHDGESKDPDPEIE